ncbi:hypothetical protein NE237_031670 [Protea cynaroides]|uniref:Uncharacterized protein n=1 Tax=Protea cynaroides TaxID=273540 RepID=A0A9Q0R2D8_9MAGN|nr:hypothetical protein NE237_031670 [Protea cynaroides]
MNFIYSHCYGMRLGIEMEEALNQMWEFNMIYFQWCSILECSWKTRLSSLIQSEIHSVMANCMNHLIHFNKNKFGFQRMICNLNYPILDNKQYPQILCYLR